MTVQGIVQNGIVVLPPETQIPEGTVVSVSFSPATPPLPRDRMSDEQHRKLLAALDAVAALPIESSGEPFSGRDHDKVLYGEMP
jgi:hypothetical protein